MAKLNKNTKRQPHTHDLRNRYWGHDYSYTPLDEKGLRAELMGWNSASMNVKDYVLIQHPQGGYARYQIDKIRFEHDPADMFWSEISYAPPTAPPIEV